LLRHKDNLRPSQNSDQNGKIQGNIFIADKDNSRFRRVDATTGIITTVAGNGQPAFGGDGGPAVSASLNLPFGLAIDGEDNLYIADSQNNRLRVVIAQGADFNLAVSPLAQTIIAGGSMSFTINAQSLKGFSQAVNLSAMINPPNSGATLTLSTSSITPGNAATLTINGSVSATTGTFTVTVTGTAGQIVHSRIASLTINPRGQGGFTLIANPQPLNVNAGETANITVIAQPIDGLIEPINLTRILAPDPQGITIASSADTIVPGASATISVTGQQAMHRQITTHLLSRVRQQWVNSHYRGADKCFQHSLLNSFQPTNGNNKAAQQSTS
jgi:hypothetical protein